ncbi:hypothetical protein ACKUS6_04285 [Klebsiella michiganensis]
MDDERKGDGFGFVDGKDDEVIWEGEEGDGCDVFAMTGNGDGQGNRMAVAVDGGGAWEVEMDGMMGRWTTKVKGWPASGHFTVGNGEVVWWWWWWWWWVVVVGGGWWLVVVVVVVGVVGVVVVVVVVAWWWVVGGVVVVGGWVVVDGGGVWWWWWVVVVCGGGVWCVVVGGGGGWWVVVQAMVRRGWAPGTQRLW